MTLSRPLIGLLAASIVIVLLTLLIPMSVADQTGLASVWMGYPFTFLRQDFSGIDPPSFPWSVSAASPWEYGMAVQWPMFLLDVLLIFIALSIVAFLMVRTRRVR